MTITIPWTRSRTSVSLRERWLARTGRPVRAERSTLTGRLAATIVPLGLLPLPEADPDVDRDVDLAIARTFAAARLAEHGLRLVLVTESDWQALADLVDELTADGRNARFHGSVSLLVEPKARQLAAAEPGRRVGYAAATPDGRFVAHAMLGATEGDGPEFAVMTAPDWEGRGLASTLGSLLVEQSRAQGVPFWCAEIRSDNAAAFALCSKLGVLERRHWDDGSVHVHVHI